jgi:hypothetical protein
MDEFYRYNLKLPRELFDELQAVADAKHTSVAEVIRQFIRLGTLATKPGVEIVLREPNKESVILFL